MLPESGQLPRLAGGGYQASPGPRKLPFVGASRVLYSRLHLHNVTSVSPLHWICLEPPGHSLLFCDSVNLRLESSPSQGIRSSGAKSFLTIHRQNHH